MSDVIIILDGQPAETPVTTPYCNRSDLEMIYGPANVAKWADVDNLGDLSLIAKRILWGTRYATDYLNSKLDYGPYDMPVAVGLVPGVLVMATARLAGIMLYDSRAVSDTADDGAKTSLSTHRKQVKDFTNGVLSGRVSLPGLTRTTDHPVVVPIHTQGERRYPNGLDWEPILSWYEEFWDGNPGAWWF